jgi:hypothetical protein
MTKWELDHLADLSHLLPAATDIIITDLVQVILFLVTLDRFAFAVDDGVLSDNSVLRRIHLDHLELDLSHTTAYDEEITLPDGPIGFTEVWRKEDVEERASETLDGIGDGKDGDTLGL